MHGSSQSDQNSTHSIILFICEKAIYIYIYDFVREGFHWKLNPDTEKLNGLTFPQIRYIMYNITFNHMLVGAGNDVYLPDMVNQLLCTFWSSCLEIADIVWQV
jgi:hypothetical protein